MDDHKEEHCRTGGVPRSLERSSRKREKDPSFYDDEGWKKKNTDQMEIQGGE